MRKDDVFEFANKVKLLLISLENTEIVGDDYKIKQISKLYSEIEKEVDRFLPTIEETYSIRTKKAYCEKQNAFDEYEKAKQQGNLVLIKETCKLYHEKSEKYNNLKKIRDAIKEKVANN